MRLADDRDDTLRAAAECALDGLRQRAFERLQASFGYAIALGREPDAALRDDAGQAVAELDGRDVEWRQRPVDIVIERFRDDAAGIVAALDCRLAAGPAEGVSILQLVVTRKDGQFWLTLEGVGDGG